MDTAQIIQFPVIPRKAADRSGQLYSCKTCGHEAKLPGSGREITWCDRCLSVPQLCEMRPVEAK